MSGGEDTHCTDHQPIIGILLGDRGNPFWAAMQREYETAAPQFGLEVRHFHAHPERDPVAQREALRLLVEGPYDALIVNPLDQENLAPVILMAADRRIPVFDVGGKTDAGSVTAAGSYYIPVLTVDFLEQGRIAGRLLARELQKTGGGRVAVIEGRPESKQSIGRIAGVLEILESEPGIHVVARVPAHFDRELAAEAALEVLVEQPSLDAFFCANDLMALGVADALIGRHDTVPEKSVEQQRPLIVGVDGTEEALQAVDAGIMTATVAFSPADVAQVILGAAATVLKGGEPPSGHTVASRLVTRESAALGRLAQSVVEMSPDAAVSSAHEVLALGIDAYRAVEQGLMAGMAEVGRLYESYEYFVPELLLAGDAMNAALDVLRPHLSAAGTGRGTVVLGVVQGDIHDIGKNVVRAMLEAAGFEVIDLGKDVSPEEFLEAAERHHAQVIALSALMTTTMARMKDVVDLLEAEGRRRGVRVIVGGAPLSAEFAAGIGADAYSPTAVTAVNDIAALVEPGKHEA